MSSVSPSHDRRTVYIGLQPGGGFMGWCVRLVTRSRYGHALLRIDERCFSAGRRGWGWSYLDDLKGSVVWFAVSVSDAQKTAMYQWCLQRVGWRYDWISVLKFTTLWRLVFASREAKRDRGKLFCSEGVYRCFREAADIRLLGEVEDWEVAPGHFRFSSRCTRVGS